MRVHEVRPFDLCGPPDAASCEQPTGAARGVPRHLTHSFLDSLGDDERDALIVAGQVRKWSRGDVLMRSGDRADSAILILSGLVKIYKTAEASEVVLALRGPGDILGEITAVRDSVRAASVVALKPVSGVVISVSSLRAFLAEHSTAAIAFLELALTRLTSSDTRRMEFRDVRQPRARDKPSGRAGRALRRAVRRRRGRGGATDQPGGAGLVERVLARIDRAGAAHAAIARADRNRAAQPAGPGSRWAPGPCGAAVSANPKPRAPWSTSGAAVCALWSRARERLPPSSCASSLRARTSPTSVATWAC